MQHLLGDENDPFNRAKLTVDQLIPGSIFTADCNIITITNVSSLRFNLRDLLGPILDFVKPWVAAVELKSQIDAWIAAKKQERK